MVRKNISTVREPFLENILMVRIGGFGYLSPEVDKKYLETLSLATCIGVYVQNNETQALAHISHNFSKSTSLFLEYLKYTHQKFHCH